MSIRFVFRSLLTISALSLLILLPAGRGVAEAASANRVLLARHTSSEPVSISSKRLETLSEAVVLVKGYDPLPMYTFTYERVNGILIATPKQVGIMRVTHSTGSGFFVTSSGYLVTNSHVADGALSYAVVTDDATYDTLVIYRDREHDLAILKVSPNKKQFEALQLADTKPSVGEPVFSIGNALGTYVDSVSIGNVLSLSEDVIATDRGEHTESTLLGVIKTSAKLYPGDSGGPLLNAKGKVVGVSVATTIGENVGFAVPLEALADALAVINVK